MAKELKYSEDARTLILNGVNALAKKRTRRNYGDRKGNSDEKNRC